MFPQGVIIGKVLDTSKAVLPPCSPPNTRENLYQHKQHKSLLRPPDVIP